MGKEEKIRGAHARAAIIFRQMQKIKKDGIERVTAELGDLLMGLDSETAEVLNKIYLNKKSEVENMEDRMGKKIESVIEKIKSKKSDGKNILLLTLSKDGDLYREPKEKHCYPMKKSARRIDIIRFLIGKKNFISGNDMEEEFRVKYGSITFAILEINRISQHLLHLPKNEKLIISRPRGGYKLNPLFPIQDEM